MDLSRIDPDVCTCRKKPLPTLVAEWSKRTQSRILAVMKEGRKVNFDAVKKEASLVVSLSREGPAAFAEQNGHYGHFCDTCPYRLKTPLKDTLAVDRTDSRG